MWTVPQIISQIILKHPLMAAFSISINNNMARDRTTMFSFMTRKRLHNSSTIHYEGMLWLRENPSDRRLLHLQRGFCRHRRRWCTAARPPSLYLLPPFTSAKRWWECLDITMSLFSFQKGPKKSLHSNCHIKFLDACIEH
jgi:hypothetical protein